MYGLLLESIANYICKSLGNDAWENVKKKVGINYQEFAAKKIYSETLIMRIIAATEELHGISRKTLMVENGKFFIESMKNQGFSKMLKVLGRNFSDFLNGLDNLHEYIRFTYPRLKAPSFSCESDYETGVLLRYRSKRKGYQDYVMGIIIGAAKIYYKLDLEISITKDLSTKDMTDVFYDLKFPNKKFKRENLYSCKVEQFPISTGQFLGLFPFHMVFDRNLIIISAGSALRTLIEYIIGQSLDETFVIIKPLIETEFSEIIGHKNNVFELQSLYETRKSDQEDITSLDTQINSVDDYGSMTPSNSENSTKILLKGQMIKFQENLLFIGVPVISNIEMLSSIGLYLNDLSMHDSSRELLVAGAQQHAELKLALDRELKRGHELEQCMQKLDMEKGRKEDLLYQLIPREICTKLNSSYNNNICEVCDSVTLLFTDIVGFTTVCSKITPMEVVGILNLLYTGFDECIEKGHTFKVETIGDAYLVCGGLPLKSKTHATDIVETALLMMASLRNFKNPFTDEVLQMRAGIHSGPAVAGIVDRKMPRYCIFGKIINITKKLETLSQPMRIQISDTTCELLGSKHNYVIEQREDSNITKEIGFPTFWVNGKC